MTLCKSITIICADAEPICQYIMEDLHKGATIIEGKGAYTHNRKYIVLTTLTRRQADQLWGFIHERQMEAFVSVASTNEVFGKGFEAV